MTTHEQFTAELDRRGVVAGNVQFWPGPDEQHDPEGAVIVAAPDERHGSWRVFVMDRGVRDERAFDDESSALDHVLAHHFGPRVPVGPPMSVEQFLEKVRARGLPRSWFVLPGDTGRAADGAIEIQDDPWRVGRRGEQSVAREVASQSDALRAALELIDEPRRRARHAGGA